MKSDLGFNIYKKKEGDGYIALWFLGPENKWILNKSHARTFYHKETALSALVIMKHRDEGESTD